MEDRSGMGGRETVQAQGAGGRQAFANQRLKEQRFKDKRLREIHERESGKELPPCP
jgi:hypothetical protein